MNSKVLHPKTTQNTHKLQQIPQKDVKYAVICVQSGKFYTGQNFFTRAPPVVPVTNMRYAYGALYFTPPGDIQSHPSNPLIAYAEASVSDGVFKLCLLSPTFWIEEQQESWDNEKSQIRMERWEKNVEDRGRGGGLGQWQKTWSREVVGLAGVTSEGAAKRLSDQHTLTSDPNPLLPLSSPSSIPPTSYS